jgi:hypothetical protein
MLDLQLPDSVYKPQLVTSGASTTLVQVSGEGVVKAADIPESHGPYVSRESYLEVGGAASW